LLAVEKKISGRHQANVKNTQPNAGKLAEEWPMLPAVHAAFAYKHCIPSLHVLANQDAHESTNTQSHSHWKKH